MDETALFPLPGVYFKLDRGHRRDEDPRMSLPCYKNSLQICNSLQGLCLGLYYHSWFQLIHADNLGINTLVITTGKIWTSRKPVISFFFFFAGPIRVFKLQVKLSPQNMGRQGYCWSHELGRTFQQKVWRVLGGWVQTSMRARNSWVPVLGGPKAFLAFASRNLPDSHSEDPRKISGGSGRSRRIIFVTYAQSLPHNK